MTILFVPCDSKIPAQKYFYHSQGIVLFINRLVPAAYLMEKFNTLRNDYCMGAFIQEQVIAAPGLLVDSVIYPVYRVRIPESDFTTPPVQLLVAIPGHSCRQTRRLNYTLHCFHKVIGISHNWSKKMRILKG